MYNKQTEMKLIEKINDMNIEELKELALKTLITREKTRLRKQKCIKNKNKGIGKDEI